MITVKVCHQSTGQVAKERRELLGFDGLFRGLTANEISDRVLFEIG